MRIKNTDYRMTFVLIYLLCLMTLACGSSHVTIDQKNERQLEAYGAQESDNKFDSLTSHLNRKPEPSRLSAIRSNMDGRYDLLDTGIDRYTLTDKTYTSAVEYKGYTSQTIKLLQRMNRVDTFQPYLHDIEINEFQIQIDGITWGLILEDLSEKESAELILKTKQTLTTLYLNGEQLCDTELVSAIESRSSETDKPLFLFVYGDMTRQTVSCINRYKASSLFIGLEKGDDSTIPILSKIEKLYHLELEGLDITDVGASKISAIKNLKSLNLKDTFITDNAIENIGLMSALSSLNLGSNEITDKGISPLSNLTQLEVLDLSDTLIQGRGLVYLAQLPKLVSLNLNDSYIDNDGVQNLSKFSNLATLDVGSTMLKDGGLEFLYSLTKLKRLNIQSNAITEIDVGTLKFLERLDIHSTRIESIPSIKNLDKLIEIDAEMTDVSEIDEFIHLKTLSYLDLSSASIGQIKGIEKLRNLKFLDLSYANNCLVDEEMLSSIGALAGLRHLKLNRIFENQQFDSLNHDAYLQFLENLTELRELGLEYFSTDGTVLSYLSEAKQLRYLDISQITPAKRFFYDDDSPLIEQNGLLLSNVANLRSLRYLNLDATYVHLKDMLQLASLANLVFLTASWFKEDDAPIVFDKNKLNGFKNLRELNLGILDSSIMLPLIDILSKHRNIRSLDCFASSSEHFERLYNIRTLRAVTMSRYNNANFKMPPMAFFKTIRLLGDLTIDINSLDWSNKNLSNLRNIDVSVDSKNDDLETVCNRLRQLKGLNVQYNGQYPKKFPSACKRLIELRIGRKSIKAEPAVKTLLKDIGNLQKLKKLYLQADMQQDTLNAVGEMVRLRDFESMTTLDVTKHKNAAYFRSLLVLPKLYRLYIHGPYKGKNISKYLFEKFFLGEEFRLNMDHRDYCVEMSGEDETDDFFTDEEEEDI